MALVDCYAWINKKLRRNAKILEKFGFFLNFIFSQEKLIEFIEFFTHYQNKYNANIIKNLK